MSIPLKQSTASQEIPLGIFVDSTDGNTEEPGLTIANTDIKLWKAGTITLANKNLGGATYISNGIYYTVLDDTDTNTVGPLIIFVHVTGALAVKVDCIVYPANIFDSLFAGTDTLQADVTQVGGDAQSATDLKDFADAGYDPVTNKVQGVVLTDTLTTYTGNTLQTGDAFARLGAPAGVSVSADILVIDNLVDDLESRLGTPSNLGSGATVAANLADIEGQTDDIGVAGAGLTAVPWNATWDAEVQSEVADALDAAVPGVPSANSINERIKTMDDADIPGRLPAALVTGRMDSSVGAMAAGVVTATAIATGAIDADALAADAVTEIRSLVNGTADSGSSTTVVDAARTEADTDYWKGCWILFTSGNISGQVRLITAFDAALDTITFVPAATQVVTTQTYEILPAGAVDMRLWNGTALSNLISGRVDANTQAMAANVITSSIIAADAIGASQIANGAIDAATFASGAIDNTAFNVTETLNAQVVAGGIAASAFAAGAIDAAAIATGAIDADAIADNAIDSGAIATGAITNAKFAAGAIDATAIANGAIDAATFAAGAIDAAAIADGAIDRATFAADTGWQTIRSNTAQAADGTTITLDTAASATDDFYNDTVILITGGSAGVGQVRWIRDYVGITKVATVIPAWTTTPTGTITFAILPSASVWDETLGDHLDASSTGNALNAAAGDPWSTALPGAYGAGSAGNILGNRLDAAVTTRASQTSLDTLDDYVDTEVAAIKTKTDQLNFTGTDVKATLDGETVTVATNNDKTGYALSVAGVQAIWDALTSALTTVGSVGKKLADWVLGADNKNLISTDAQDLSTTLDVRTKTFNSSLDLTATMKASVNTEVDSALNTAIPVSPTADSINERVKAIDDKLPSGSIGDATSANQTTILNRLGAFTGSGTNTILGFFRALLRKDASLTPSDVSGTYDNTTDSLEAIKDNQLDAAVSTRATPAQVNTEVVDTLNVDTYAEPSSVPAATTTLTNMVHWLFTLSRNKMTQTATTTTLRNDADTTNIATYTVSDDSTTFTSGEGA